MHTAASAVCIKLGRTMKIRAYTNEDWLRVCAIHDVARKDELAAAHLEAAFLTLEQTAENEGFHEYEIRVAEIEGTVVGFVAFTQDELSWLYVDPLFYGEGVGTALINEALSQAGPSLSAEVLVGNEAAIAVYRKAGFLEVGRASGQMPGNEQFTVEVVELRHPGVAS